MNIYRPTCFYSRFSFRYLRTFTYMKPLIHKIHHNFMDLLFKFVIKQNCNQVPFLVRFNIPILSKIAIRKQDETVKSMAPETNHKYWTAWSEPKHISVLLSVKLNMRKLEHKWSDLADFPTPLRMYARPNNLQASENVEKYTDQNLRLGQLLSKPRQTAMVINCYYCIQSCVARY